MTIHGEIEDLPEMHTPTETFLQVVPAFFRDCSWDLPSHIVQEPQNRCACPVQIRPGCWRGRWCHIRIIADQVIGRSEIIETHTDILYLLNDRTVFDVELLCERLPGPGSQQAVFIVLEFCELGVDPRLERSFSEHSRTKRVDRADIAAIDIAQPCRKTVPFDRIGFGSMSLFQSKLENFSQVGCGFSSEGHRGEPVGWGYALPQEGHHSPDETGRLPCACSGLDQKIGRQVVFNEPARRLVGKRHLTPRHPSTCGKAPAQSRLFLSFPVCPRVSSWPVPGHHRLTDSRSMDRNRNPGPEERPLP